ncbi:MAG: hypothetical protein NC925_00690 [Candidatus Omnitrophica bacterium]|nr:hypothetical protein [Candidatus Omnitrophota bacterium]MCM8831586.1 hypothetical protein [Candidatus Omnitrophota bacterium]
MQIQRRIDKPLGQLLIERGIISQADLNKALEVQKKEGGLLGEILVKLRLAKEENITQCISIQYGFPYISLDNYEIQEEALKIIPKNVASYYCLLPIDKIGDNLIVAMAEPSNIQAIQDLEDISGCNIQIFISTPSDIRKHIENFYK